ncbi:beta-glucosidase [Namhaeicola litoreus]|uniref:Beta-glucosidase n=1 Tax=Namhaeicola litoreus TaxID=1052145 RepID=A0ABW3XYW0_9FLAO
MKSKIVFGIITLFLSFFSVGQNLSQNKSRDLIIEERIDSIIGLLTLEEKVAMCHAQSKFSTPGVPRLGIPEIWMSDGPHGVRGEINWDNWGYAGWTNDSITAFPALTCLAASFNPSLAKAYGQSVGEEARYRKKDVLLGPGVNIYRTPLNGRNFEYMGEDPFLASTLVVPYIQGVQENGVAACLKHFVLNNQEKWRGHISVEVSDRALYEIYLPAFKAAVEQGKVWAVMGAYNKFRGQYCSHHELLINKILKSDWKFDGVLITDWGSAHNTKEAALYGLDMEMGTGTDGLTSTLKNAYDNYYLAYPFLQMIKNGEIEERFLDEKVKRILRLMYRTNMNPTRSFGKANNQEHLDIARKIAQEGIVLLKNDSDIFPIDPNKKMTIAIIGENATRKMAPGGGSSELKPKFEISPLQGIQERFKNATILHSMGYASGPPVYGNVIPSKLNADSLKSAAINIAKQADLVLFVGGLNKNHLQDCEGGDRLSYDLPFGQNEMINEISNVNNNIGVVLISGNAVAMPWLPKVKGLVQSWYLGSESGHALADILSGDVNPSGKLPFTYPIKLTDNGAHYFGELSYPGDSIKQYYKEDIFVGYRWHEHKKITPQFAFGEGLSYTDFKIDNIEILDKTVSAENHLKIDCDIKNIGSREGSEVIQVYVGKPKSIVKRAVKELKGFEKVFLKSGEKKTITITIDPKSLAFYDETISDWHLEKGEYIIYVGTASNKIDQKLKIDVQ